MKNTKNIILSLTISIGFGFVLQSIYSLSLTQSSSLIHRLMIVLGGNIQNGGYIQVLTYFAFLWAMFEMRDLNSRLKHERKGFTLGLIPTSEKHIFMPADLNALKFKLIDFEKKEGKYILAEVIKKACTKFRTSGSLSDLIEIVSIQIEVSQEKSESEQSTIRYLTWVIPSIGFIGTVLGISQALTVANSGDMEQITSLLGVAFDTTLIALLLSVVIMWFVHQLQEETDRFHADLKEFVVDNLINKIELT